jgi:hypothetical protein
VELERNRDTEQTFSVTVNVTAPTNGVSAATLETSGTTGRNSSDYALGSSLILLFTPTVESVVFLFFVKSDDLEEGEEAFLAIISQNEEFTGPTFNVNTSSSTAEIRIVDYNGD